MVLNPKPNDSVRATTLANCSPSPSAQRMSPAAKMGNIPGKITANEKMKDRNARTGLNHQSGVQFLDHRRTILSGDHRQTRQRYLVTRVIALRRVQALFR